MLLLKGEVWIITGRKGRLTVKLLHDVDTYENMFFDAELVAGTPHHMSIIHDEILIGDIMTFRVSLTTFVRRSND